MPFTTLISTDALAEHLGDPAWVICDCRFALADPGGGEGAYRHGHIPAACYVHLDRDMSSPVTAGSGRHPLPERKALSARLGELGIARDSQVVAYDDAGGAFAARLWWLLRWLGHERVAVLDGGWGKWLREGRPVTGAATPTRTSVFLAGPPLSEAVTAEEVQAALARQAILLLDARAPQRFRGEVEPLDAVAGHVPGAVNRPLHLNLGGEGQFLAPEQLRRQFSRRLARFRPEEVVHMCGSGVTACHNLLAMETAGLKGSRLYAGSWSEWIRNPARRVAMGAE